MAQGRPITRAVSNFFSQFNQGQEIRRRREQEENRVQAIIDAAEIKRQQELDDREDLALSIEQSLGIDISDVPAPTTREPQVEEPGIFPGPQRTAGADGIVEEDITRGGITIPGSPTGTERRGPGRKQDFTFTQKQRKAFSEAIAINPSVSAPILNFLTKANDFQLQQESNRTGRNLRGGLFLQDQLKKSPVLFQEGIRQLVESGVYGEEEIEVLVELSNETNDDLVNLKLEKLVLDSTPRKILLEEEVAKRKEARAVQPGFTLSPGQVRFGAAGEEIARVEVAPPAPEQRTTLAKNLELAGIDPLSAEGRQIIKDSITKPGVKIDLNEGLDFKIPPGFLPDVQNGKIVGVKPIPGGPKDTLPAEAASKTMMLKTAQKAFKGARPLFFDKDGSLNRLNIFNAQFNTPFTEGRKLRVQMEFGIQGITRGETGAAMPPEEVENTRDRFQPQIGDTVEIANLKLDMFEEMLAGTLDLIDPTGTFIKDEEGKTVKKLALNQQKFDAELQKRVGGQTGRTPKTGAKTFTIRRKQ